MQARSLCKYRVRSCPHLKLELFARHEFGEMRILMFLKSIVLTGFILIPEFPGLTQGQVLSHFPVHF